MQVFGQRTADGDHSGSSSLFGSLSAMFILRASLLAALICAAAFAQQPRIDSVSPSQGPIAGGAAVSVRGANFGGATAALDGVTIAPLSQSDSEVRLQMTQHDNGFAVISLRNASGIAYGEFLYLPPALTDLPPGFITTVAGMGTFTRDYGPAKQANIGPWGLDLDRNGNLYIGDAGAGRVYRIRGDGTIERFAGGSIGPQTGDGGAAAGASFDLPNNDLGGIALDSKGNVYLADDGNGRIRRIDRVTGIITTFYKETPGTNDSVGGIRSLAFDRDGNLYYGGSGRIVKVNASGAFITSYGNGTYALPVDGVPAATSGLGLVAGIAIDAAGNILYSDDAIRRVRRIDVSTGLLDTVAGIGPSVIGENGPALATTINFLTDIAFDHDGNLLVGETLRLRKLDRSDEIDSIPVPRFALHRRSGRVRRGTFLRS
jgi:hypothetical protein